MSITAIAVKVYASLVMHIMGLERNLPASVREQGKEPISYILRLDTIAMYLRMAFLATATVYKVKLFQCACSWTY